MCIGKKKKPSREKGIWSSKGEDRKYEVARSNLYFISEILMFVGWILY